MSSQGPNEGSSGPQGAPREPGGTGFQPRPSTQAWRAVLVVVVAVVVGVAVLGRMNGATGTVAPPVKRTTTTVRVRAATATTVPRTTPSSLPSTSTTTATATATTLPPSSVLVLVLNGWTTRHAALFYKNTLAPYGYDLLVPVDAATDTNKTSEVFYVHPQYKAVAETVAADIASPPPPVAPAVLASDPELTAADLNAADVIVLVGEDISGKVPAGYNG